MPKPPCPSTRPSRYWLCKTVRKGSWIGDSGRASFCHPQWRQYGPSAEPPLAGSMHPMQNSTAFMMSPCRRKRLRSEILLPLEFFALEGNQHELATSELDHIVGLQFHGRVHERLVQVHEACGVAGHEPEHALLGIEGDGGMLLAGDRFVIGDCDIHGRGTADEVLLHVNAIVVPA